MLKKNCNIAVPSYTLNSIFIFNDINLINTLILKLTTDWSQAVKLLHKLNQLLKEQLLPRRSHCRSPAKCCSRYNLTSAPIGNESVTFCCPLRKLRTTNLPTEQPTNQRTHFMKVHREATHRPNLRHLIERRSFEWVAKFLLFFIYLIIVRFLLVTVDFMKFSLHKKSEWTVNEWLMFFHFSKIVLAVTMEFNNCLFWRKRLWKSDALEEVSFRFLRYLSYFIYSRKVI